MLCRYESKRTYHFWKGTCEYGHFKTLRLMVETSYRFFIDTFGQTSLYLRVPRVSQPVVEQWAMCTLCSDETAV